MEAEGQRSGDAYVDSQEIGLAFRSVILYNALKNRTKEFNVQKKKVGDIISQMDHVPHITLKKFDDMLLQ